jgi:hypothetical protein
LVNGVYTAGGLFNGVSEVDPFDRELNFDFTSLDFLLWATVSCIFHRFVKTAD